MKSSAGPVEPDGSYEVERIIDIRASKARGTEFLIKWRFYEDEHNTWEPEGLLDNCPLVKSAFKKAGGRSLSRGCPRLKGLPSTRRCSGRVRGGDLLFLAERE